MPHASPSLSRQQWLLGNAVLLISSLVGLIILQQYSNVDLWLANWVFDPASGQFPWRDQWLTAKLGHDWMKKLSVMLGVAVAWQLYRQQRLAGWQDLATRQWLVVGLSALLVPVLVTQFKHLSVLHCPWDLQQFGGHAPYLRLFDRLPLGVGAGQCYPAGHASSGSWLLGFIALWLPLERRQALIRLPLLLLPGLMLGWIQQLRGAHFLSHTLATLWLSWLIVSLLCAWLLWPQAKGASSCLAYESGTR
ncbi:phosphatase PAP2 family protein [Chitinibacter tainanensis]|uniref:phosphatase PAP2 family protein n=1 Tax=Chitinibacter tainanensis TaxID=230667 RepID=UPI000417BCD4|nr:phosphatase PAP2 family protein [Chitinibacter tainanensis]